MEIIPTPQTAESSLEFHKSQELLDTKTNPNHQKQFQTRKDSFQSNIRLIGKPSNLHPQIANIAEEQEKLSIAKIATDAEKRSVRLAAMRKHVTHAEAMASLRALN